MKLPGTRRIYLSSSAPFFFVEEYRTETVKGR